MSIIVLVKILFMKRKIIFLTYTYLNQNYWDNGEEYYIKSKIGKAGVWTPR